MHVLATHMGYKKSNGFMAAIHQTTRGSEEAFIKTINQWFDDYAVSHQHKTNVAIHVIAVPAIVISIVGLLWSLPFFVAIHPLINWASLALVVVFLFHVRLSRSLAFGFASLVAVMLVLLWWAQVSSPMLAIIMGSIFAVAWLLQFIGHHIEGTRPSFLKDLQFLLIGPLWLLAKFYRKVKIPW